MSRNETLKDIFANRFYVVYGVAFFALWGAGTVTADLLALPTHYTVMVGIIAATILDQLADWLHEWRQAEQEVEKHVA